MRPIEELRLRAGVLLDPRVSKELRVQCVEIARTKAPSSAFDLGARAALLSGFGQMEQIGVAKATRWLAVVRRDYGVEAFEELARTLAK